MGCKESKHKAVAQGNTIIAPSSGRKSSQNVNDKKNNVDRRMQKQESSKNINVGDSKLSKDNENLGNDNYGAVNVNAVLEKENKRLKKLNHQNNNNNNNIVTKKEANIEKENQESILVPKVNLLSSSRKDGESIEAIISDGISGASAYYTPTTEVAGALEVNAKRESHDERKKGPVEEIKGVKTGIGEDDAKEIPGKDVDAAAKNHARENEVNEKIKEAEAAVAALEDLVKEANEAEEILVTDFNATDPTIQKPVNEAPGTEAAEVTSANLSVEEADQCKELNEAKSEASVSRQKPMKEADKSDQIQDNEAGASDGTLQNADVATDKTIENLIREAEEAADNGVKDIHEVIGKSEDVPVKEAEGNQKMVSDRAEEVPETEAEVVFATPNDTVKENEVAKEAEAASMSEESHAKESESETKFQSKDAAITEEETKNFSTANTHQEFKDDTANN